MKLRSYVKRGAKIAGLAVLGLICILLIIGLIPVSTGDLASEPAPSTKYTEAAARIQAVIDSETGQVCDICGTRFYTHGDKTARAVVLIHGLTNSPRQFQEIGQTLFNDGYNVLIVRMPYHGLMTHTVSELGNLTAKDLQVFADQSVDMAAGIGDEVTVVGLSGGGTVSAWIAQNRSDVNKCVLIAPLFGLSGVPSFGNSLLGNLCSRIPDIDFSSSSEPPRASVYLGWSTRGVAEYLLLAKAVRRQTDDSPTAVRNVVLITNANDHTVNNNISGQVMDVWQNSGTRVMRFEFDESLGLPHDYIDITSIGDKSGEVYPVVVNLIETG